MHDATRNDPLANPYAPPRKAEKGWQPPRVPSRPAAELDEALRRLREHVADPGNLESDLRATGGRLSTLGPVLLVLGVVGLGAGAALWLRQRGFEDETLPIIVASVGGLFALRGFIVAIVDLRIASRSSPTAPERTLKDFFRAIAMRRTGYVWAMLCPTAREQTVSTPDLDPVQTSPGQFSLLGERGVKSYLASFARSSGATMRVVGAKKLVAGPTDGDVARVRAELMFQSWPRWVNVVAVIGFFVFRPLVLVGIVAYFVARKRRVVRVEKTMLRAQNGVWYVHDGDILEGTASAP